MTFKVLSAISISHARQRARFHGWGIGQWTFIDSEKKLMGIHGDCLNQHLIIHTDLPSGLLEARGLLK